MLEFLCPKCRKRLRVDEGLAGKQGRCPSCRETILMPKPSQALKPAPNAGAADDDEMPLPTEVLVSPEMGAPARPAPLPRPAAPGPVAAKKPAPPKAAPAGGSSGLGTKLLLLAIPIVVIVAGIAVYFLFIRR